MLTLKRLFIFLFGFIFMAILVTGWLYYHYHRNISLPVAPYEFSIEPGSNLKQINKQLADEGILPNSWSFILLSRLLGHESSVKAGDYRLSGELNQIALLEYLIKGDVRQNEVRFIEGWTFSQFRETLYEHPNIRNITVGMSEEEILALIGATEKSAEGLFFPDTYYIVKNSTDIEVLRRAYQTMQNHIQAAWVKRMESLPLESPYEALILASIVEKETGMDSDRAEIAGVFVNRLRIGMRLQTDPTVIYGLGNQFDGNLRKKDLQTDHDYNTYTRAGLPPTPIAMPGLASIYAAVNPATTDSLYFVAKGNGESKFSTNLADHNRAVAKYQRQQRN
ncbi:MAG: endolytic transglycosylase MltG [Burkholderiales bacterium]|uniref:endolytic transglycosylase MltG n=1 Tax=Nitrosomonas sp. TaxID=42353 RepID=UPI001DFD531C|nr:endolytic transglycosylase MltG [Nitrosomonas sp.]MCB1949984.1 endolytic transglycosylase MltG [Nitrosomonas sp.]MCP5243366.1 endolytic transglycosylase MltG [Burkholderiales bacterium]